MKASTCKQASARKIYEGNLLLGPNVMPLVRGLLCLPGGQASSFLLCHCIVWTHVIDIYQASIKLVSLKTLKSAACSHKERQVKQAP
jgi:hypothetical protein